MKISNQLTNAVQRAVKSLNSVTDHIATLPELGDIDSLMEILEEWDARYKEYCEDHDTESDNPVGTTYNSSCGTNMEYYVESDDMHSLSLVFRNLKQMQQERSNVK